MLPFGTASRLSVEIIDAILVEAFDATAAAHAGLVNKAFRRLTLPIAFRLIRCGQPSSLVRSILQWNLQLTHCPEIARCVRAIAVSGTVPGLPAELKRLVALCSEGYPLVSIYFEDTNLTWLYNSTLISAILLPFTNVHISTLHGVTTTHIRSVLTASPALEHLAIGDPDAHWIQHVAFSNPRPVDQSPRQPSPSTIRRLTVAIHHDSDDGLLAILSRIQYRENWALVHLNLVLSSRTSAGVGEVIRLAAPTLVALQYAHKGPLLSIPFSLADCLLLKTLHLRTSAAATSLDPLLQVLESRSTVENGQLRTLEIGLDGSTMDVFTWDELARRLFASGSNPSSTSITLRPAFGMGHAVLGIKDIARIQAILIIHLGNVKFIVAHDLDPFPDDV